MPSKPKVKIGANRPSHLGITDPEVWGIYVGMGCVSADSPLEWRGILAHAHNDPDDEWYGWICIDRASRVLTKTGKPTTILLHEIAHLKVPGEHHSKKWRNTLTLMGAGREASKYERKQPKKAVVDCGVAPVSQPEEDADKHGGAHHHDQHPR